MTKKEQSRLRDEFAIAAIQGMYANAELVNKAARDWVESGGSRPTCIAEWFAGMAYESADAALAARIAK